MTILLQRLSLLLVVSNARRFVLQAATNNSERLRTWLLPLTQTDNIGGNNVLNAIRYLYL
jgi:hypothetical protein